MDYPIAWVVCSVYFCGEWFQEVKCHESAMQCTSGLSSTHPYHRSIPESCSSDVLGLSVDRLMNNYNTHKVGTPFSFRNTTPPRTFEQYAIMMHLRILELIFVRASIKWTNPNNFWPLYYPWCRHRESAHSTWAESIVMYVLGFLLCRINL